MYHLRDVETSCSCRQENYKAEKLIMGFCDVAQFMFLLLHSESNQAEQESRRGFNLFYEIFCVCLSFAVRISPLIQRQR